MGYENAPATKMLATHCAACNRPLVDAVSVEIGMGPDCREKHGYSDGPIEAREQANAAIHAIACDKSPGNALPAIATLEILGFTRLAKLIQTRLSAVVVEEIPGTFTLAVDTSYDPAVVQAMRSIPGRRWDAQRKVNTFPVSSRGQLWSIIKRFYSGKMVLGPKGCVVA